MTIWPIRTEPNRTGFTQAFHSQPVRQSGSSGSPPGASPAGVSQPSKKRRKSGRPMKPSLLLSNLPKVVPKGRTVGVGRVSIGRQKEDGRVSCGSGIQPMKRRGSNRYIRPDRGFHRLTCPLRAAAAWSRVIGGGAPLYGRRSPPVASPPEFTEFSMYKDRWA